MIISRSYTTSSFLHVHKTAKFTNIQLLRTKDAILDQSCTDSLVSRQLQLTQPHLSGLIVEDLHHSPPNGITFKTQPGQSHGQVNGKNWHVPKETLEQKSRHHFIHSKLLYTVKNNVGKRRLQYFFFFN